MMGSRNRMMGFKEFVESPDFARLQESKRGGASGKTSGETCGRTFSKTCVKTSGKTCGKETLKILVRKISSPYRLPMSRESISQNFCLIVGCA